MHITIITITERQTGISAAEQLDIRSAKENERELSTARSPHSLWIVQVDRFPHYPPPVHTNKI